jgi:uncharacterized repeat protein (TIGR02543 family)
MPTSAMNRPSRRHHLSASPLLKLLLSLCLAGCAVGCGSSGSSVGEPCPDGVCPDGQTCVDGYCQSDADLDPACVDVECPGGEVCVAGECVVDPANNTACTADEDCPANAICLYSACVMAAEVVAAEDRIATENPTVTFDTFLVGDAFTLTAPVPLVFPADLETLLAGDGTAEDADAAEEAEDIADADATEDTDTAGAADGESTDTEEPLAGQEVTDVGDDGSADAAEDSADDASGDAATDGEDATDGSAGTADGSDEIETVTELPVTIVELVEAENCTCVWSVEPTSLVNFTDPAACTAGATILEAGGGTISVDVTCDDAADTFTQDILAAEPEVPCETNRDCPSDEVCTDNLCADRLGPSLELIRDYSQPPYVVSLDVRLEDANGTAIADGVTAEQVRLLEGTMELDAAESNYFVSPAADLPHNIALVLDYSSSMAAAEALEPMIEAARGFVSADFLNDTHQIAILECHDRMEEGSGFNVVAPLTVTDAAGISSLYEAIPAAPSIEPGLSRLWDATTRALDLLTASEAEPGELRSLVLITDGVDTTSTTAPADILTAAQNNDVAIYILSMTSDASALATMQELTANTGGQYYNQINNDVLPLIFAPVADDLRGQWNIRYVTPTNAGSVDLTMELTWLGQTTELLHTFTADDLVGDAHQVLIDVRATGYDAANDVTTFELWADYIPRNIAAFAFAFGEPDAAFELEASGALLNTDDGWTMSSTTQNVVSLASDEPLPAGSTGMLGTVAVPGEATALQVTHNDEIYTTLPQPKTVLFSGEAWQAPKLLTLTLEPPEAGFVLRDPAQFVYAENQEVGLSAVAFENYVFSGWSGGAQGSEALTTVTMDTDREVVAAFYPPYTIQTSVEPDVAGLVALEPQQALYRHGETVQFSAVGQDYYAFAQWEGSITGTESPVEVAIEADMQVIAHFHEPRRLTLSVEPSEAGSIAASPNRTTFYHGETISLIPVANGNYVFKGWTGDLNGSTNPAEVTITTNLAIGAEFYPPRTLSIIIEPAGIGTVTRSPNQTTYAHGSVVTLTATSGTATFSGWNGDANGSTATIDVTMNADKTITASFTPP